MALKEKTPVVANCTVRFDTKTKMYRRGRLCWEVVLLRSRDYGTREGHISSAGERRAVARCDVEDGVSSWRQNVSNPR
jgi:hypothetical protein